MRLYLAFLALFLICWQSFWWRSNAFQVSIYEAKLLTGNLTTREQFDWGRLAIRLEEFDAAISIFNRLLQKHHNLSPALAQLAIAHAQNGQCEESIKSFETLRGITQPGPMSYYWNGYCRETSGDSQGARESYYMSTSMSVEASRAPESLALLLGKQGYRDEALSILAFVSGGRPYQSQRWRRAINELLVVINQTTGVATEKIKSIQLPGVDSDHFWVPLRLGPELEFEFVKVNPSLEISQMSDEIWDQLNIGSEIHRDVSSSELKNLEAIEFGPWLLESIPINVCDNCETVLGKDILSQFDFSVEKEFGLRFLSLRRL